MRPVGRELRTGARVRGAVRCEPLDQDGLGAGVLHVDGAAELLQARNSEPFERLGQHDPARPAGGIDEFLATPRLEDDDLELASDVL
jgi:hypothetical protein